MRASDAERERVAETLREAVAEGRLEMDEFEQRLDATFKARTHGELVPLVRDLPASGGPVAGRKASSANWPARIGGAPTSSGAFAFWGGFSRKGRWTVGPRFTAFAMWGGGEIDLREAHFAERDVVIRCFTIMGGMQVTVPPDLNVQVNGLGIMGGFGEHSKLDEEPEPAPDAPRVRITGFALMGGVGVERKRSKAEKRRLQEEERQRLGKPDAGDGRKELG
ncbi:DUF1707 domain-containing protein [Streptomyces sp. NPDC053741]|nr:MULTISPECIES: DUF1707 domain-containing protein [Streptomyces]AGJ55196.1 hypothetical protein F750_2715 [Streptomyces sp. PAMC 26508]MCY1651776.1 DUF1707 domain-containing protein [Streptomyces sp. SL203]MCY1681035.1 DUF1707 domain-containing protein [Streptomyces sp. SL294]MDF6062746.1 DUF1707 domain-containing protein [Streptomyces sp. JH010]MDX2621861.1 DUF1707 domain-containing protein [Streptomyces sp. WI03-5b]